MNDQNDLSEYIKKIMEMYNEKECEGKDGADGINSFQISMQFIHNMAKQIIDDLRDLGANDTSILFVSTQVAIDSIPTRLPQADFGFIMALVLAIRDEVQHQLHETQTGDNQ